MSKLLFFSDYLGGNIRQDGPGSYRRIILILWNHWADYLMVMSPAGTSLSSKLVYDLIDL